LGEEPNEVSDLITFTVSLTCVQNAWIYPSVIWSSSLAHLLQANTFNHRHHSCQIFRCNTLRLPLQLVQIFHFVHPLLPRGTKVVVNLLCWDFFSV